MLEVDGVKLLYAVALSLGLSRRAIAVLFDQRSLNHLLALGAIDQPELTALLRTLASRPATRWDEGEHFNYR